MTIILEGLDRVGKSTQAEKLLSVLHDLPVHTLHYSSPKGFKDKLEAKAWLTRQYQTMFQLTASMYGKAHFILDRSHVSEMVYAPMYRGYSGDYVLEIERDAWNFIPFVMNDTCLVTFVDEPEHLVAREDGLSFAADVESKKREIDAFLAATEKSTLRHKKVINISGKDPDAVFAELLDFLRREIGQVGGEK